MNVNLIKHPVIYSCFIGYDRGEDGKIVINESEANIVRFIFKSRLRGYSDTAIARRLTELGVPAPYGVEVIGLLPGIRGTYYLKGK